MAESGAIARIIGDRGYGFIRDARGQELFFHATSVEGAVFEGTFPIGDAGQSQVFRVEAVGIGDEHTVFFQMDNVGTQCSGVHYHQDIALIAGRKDFHAAKVQLVTRYTGQCSLRRADFRREIGKCGEVVAGERGRERELSARQLHTVAAIAREADDDGFLGWMCLGFLRGQNMGRCSHERNYLTP